MILASPPALCQKWTLCHASHKYCDISAKLVFFQLSIERLPPNAEDPGSLRTISLDTFHDALNVSLFELPQGNEGSIRGCKRRHCSVNSRGKAFSVIMPFSARIIPLSITLRSSRTLPGQL